MDPAGWLAPQWADAERIGSLSGCQTIPTMDAACAALEGNPSAIGASIGWTLARTVVMGLGMHIITRGKEPVGVIAKQAFGASLAVEAFVVGWSAATKGGGDKSIASPYAVERPCEALPSDSAACRLLEGGVTEDDAFGGVLTTMLARAGIASIGIYLAGEKRPQEAIKKAAGAVSMSELVILGWAAMSKDKK